jgi:hypothetical protein
MAFRVRGILKAGPLVLVRACGGGVINWVAMSLMKVNVQAVRLIL